MVSPKQQAIDTVWSKYRVALQRLDKALDKLGQIPKQQPQPVKATLRPWGAPSPDVEIPGLDDEVTHQTKFIEDGQEVDIRDLKPDTIHQLFTEGKIPPEHMDLIRLENREGYVQSTAVTSRGESKPKLHESQALKGIYPDYKQQFTVEADNKEPVASNASFGTKFPGSPSKGDVFLRVDTAPTKLFKFNGVKWIELDKNSSTSYSYNDEYVKYLNTMLETGQYDPELLSDSEREAIEEFLGKK